MTFDNVAAIPVGLYVHLPWCVRKCPYCDFNSYAVREPLPERAYVDALLADLVEEAADLQGREIATVFIGGGTPSLFSGWAIRALLRGIAARVPLAARCEISLECNPGEVDVQRLAAYRDAGVTRLSLGMQSLRAPQLAALGRIHAPADCKAAMRAARAAAFEQLNADLMFGLPGDNPGDGCRDLAAVIALAPEHISWYQLTIEPGTPFARRAQHLPAHDHIAAASEHGLTVLAEAGYQRYEVSAYARPNCRCEHNLNYWQFGDYLGIGAGAHGKITRPQELIRRVKRRNPSRYLGADAGRVAAESTLTSCERITEFMLNGLRLVDGFQPASFVTRTGVALSAIAAPLETANRLGWLEVGADRIAPTPLGLRFLNDLQLLFVALQDPDRGAYPGYGASTANAEAG